MEKVPRSRSFIMPVFNPFLGQIIHLKQDQNNDTWLAATTSLGLLGIIARIELAVFADYKVYANQTVLDEEEVLNGDIYEQISPYVTANYWVSGPCSLLGNCV